MDQPQLKERIVAALRARGPMTSHELEIELKMEWVGFSTQLISMRRNTFNPQGEILETRVPFRGQVYHLIDQAP